MPDTPSYNVNRLYIICRLMDLNLKYSVLFYFSVSQTMESMLFFYICKIYL